MQDARALKAAAIGLMNEGRFREVCGVLHAYLRQVPTDREMLRLLVEACLKCNFVDEAERILAYLTGDAPDVFVLLGLARVAGARGALGEACRLVEAALRRDATQPLAWQLLRSLRAWRKDDPLIAKARRLLADTSTPPPLAAALCYTLCEAMNALGKWDRAWDYAERGAALAPGRFNPDDIDKVLAAQARIFDAPFLAARPGRGSPATAPIFVVGMPRSGTSLVEAILAASGQVAAMGEVAARPKITRHAARAYSGSDAPESHLDWTRAWPDPAFGEAADIYLAEIAGAAGGDVPARFVDKLPGNALHLGEIALMFPNAHIVRVERDLLDTCVSCYTGRFARGHDYTTRTDWLAKMALGVTASMDRLLPMLPNPVVTVRYEALVSEPEVQIRRLLAGLGLDWSPACLTPGDSAVLSATRSFAQIRRTISPRSVGRWRRYGDRIGPLAEALGIDLGARSAA